MIIESSDNAYVVNGSRWRGKAKNTATLNVVLIITGQESYRVSIGSKNEPIISMVERSQLPNEHS